MWVERASEGDVAWVRKLQRHVHAGSAEWTGNGFLLAAVYTPREQGWVPCKDADERGYDIESRQPAQTSAGCMFLKWPGLFRTVALDRVTCGRRLGGRYLGSAKKLSSLVSHPYSGRQAA